LFLQFLGSAFATPNLHVPSPLVLGSRLLLQELSMVDQGLDMNANGFPKNKITFG
jgi:hypothetical protein